MAPEERENVIAYLRAREQITPVYLERTREVRFADGSRAQALTFVVDRASPQYAGKLDEDTQVRIVMQGRGQAGPNRDYVINTAAHLDELGMPDLVLNRLAERLKQAAAKG